jgi:hypothetical protein
VDDELGIWILGLSLLTAGIVLVAIGRKQRAGTLRRNWVAGLRTWETMRSDEAWLAAHRATAGPVTAAGIVQLVAAAAILLLRPADDGTLLAIVLGGAGVTLGLVLAAGVHGHRIATRINQGIGGDHATGQQGPG